MIFIEQNDNYNYGYYLGRYFIIYSPEKNYKILPVSPCLLLRPFNDFLYGPLWSIKWDTQMIMNDDIKGQTSFVTLSAANVMTVRLLQLNTREE